MQVMKELEQLLPDSPLQPWLAVNNRLLFRVLPLSNEEGRLQESDIFESSSLSMNWAQAAT
jgi:hypothetical protein